MAYGNGETSLPEQPESSRGAGGKTRKPPNPKPRTTPYARPPPNPSQTPLAVRGGNGVLLDKLLDPAYRLMTAGVNRLLLGFLSRSLSIEPSVSSYADEDHDKLQGEAEHEEEDGNNRGNSDLALTRSIQSANAENIEDRSKHSRPFDAKKEERSTDLPNADGLLDVEQLIKGKAFSRDEVDRLMEILRSKIVDLPRDDGRDKQPAAEVRGVVQGPATTPESASKLKEEKQEVFNRALAEVRTPLPKSNLRNEIGASPVDIARAYMGHRVAEIGSTSVTTATGDDRPWVRLDGNSSSPFIASPSHNSSVRWPGATVPDRYLTPQTQRSRYGLHDLRRTPYSRPTHSMSKSKLIQTGDNGKKSSSGNETPLLKQSWTAINPQARSISNILDGGYGSVGPLRRARHTFGIGTPQKFDNFPSLASPSQRDKFNLPSASVPDYRKNVDADGRNSTSKPHWAEDRPQILDIGVPTVPRHSSQMARKILKQLDRTFPSPKEKSAELKLTTSWKKPMSSEAILVGDAALSHGNMEKRENDNAVHLHESRGTSLFKLPSDRSSIRIADPVGRKTSVFDADLRSSDPATGGNAESAYKVSKLAPAATESQPRDDAAKKPPACAAREALPSISIEKPELRPDLSSGSSSGFTFPVSASPASFPEPPTPSITPPPPLANSRHMPEEEESVVPSFAFGSNRSSPALVFSFLSTSSSSSSSSVPVDAADPKFTFGSGEKRISFAPITRDGVCC